MNKIELLQQLIRTESFSGQEDKTANIIQEYLAKNGVQSERLMNNVIAKNKYFSIERKSILLNSHHDTVKPNAGYSRDPFEPTIENGVLYGLGSNDAGASLVSLIETFLYFYSREDLKFNLIFVATAEEERAGKNGMLSVVKFIPKIDFAIIGEPTKMQMAIAEKGLMVLDCIAKGVSGHAAREEGENAIYNAIKDIEWFRTYKFPLISKTLGKVKTSVTQVNAGTQHNVVPAECSFVVDVRSTDKYSNHELLDIIEQNTNSDIVPRSTNIHPSSIPLEHDLVNAGIKLGLTYFGSPTLSDQCRLTCYSLKIGPGDSARSHTADEYILLSEIEHGVETYIELLKDILI
jgi:acetylornithine deacetylase